MGQTYTPAAEATSGVAVSFSIDASSDAGACSISAGKVSFSGPGTCVIDANQAGNADYLAAPQAQQKVTVHAVAQVGTSMSAPNSAAPGSELTYQLTVANSGPSAASEISVTLFLPAGVSLVSASGSPSSENSSAVQWQPVAIAAGSRVTYRVTVKLGAAASGTLVAEAWAYPYPAGSIDPNGATALAMVRTTVS
jgi:uncharacterized repeat protein (TIGR01451 family)